MKSLPFEHLTLLAPMEGVTSPPLRELLAAQGGIGAVCTEFVRVTKAPLSPRVLARHLVRPSRGVLSVQVMGNDLVQMAEATRMVTDAGADIVDINLGCPAPKAVRKGVGSAMLKDLALLGRVLEAMRRATHLPLSAKIRAGFDDASRVLDIGRVVEESGADFIAVHPRRRVDFYDGVADWRAIRLLAANLGIPVVGNGDIWYAADALRLRAETGASAVMMGRPALRNPWVFQQIAAIEAGTPPFEPDGAAVVGHLESLIEVLGAGLPPLSLTGLLKEQLRYLGRAVPDGGLFIREACRAKNAVEIMEVARRALGHRTARELDLSAFGGTLERSGTALSAETSAPCGEPEASGLVCGP